MTTSLLMSKLFSIAEPRQSEPKVAAKTKAIEVLTPKRSEVRRNGVERLFIQIVDCVDADKIGTTLSCHSTESSSGGLRITSDFNIPAGSRIDLWVNISTRPGKFFLSADVRWCSVHANGLYQIGVALIDGAATDTAAWRALHA
jgi:hypothetical protein